MTVDDVVSALRWRDHWRSRRNEAVRELVTQYRDEGLTYADACRRVSDEVQTALRGQGWSWDEIRGAGVSYGNVRVICERGV